MPYKITPVLAPRARAGFARARGEISLYHAPVGFVNRKFAQKIKPADPEILCILPIVIPARVC